MTAALVTTLPTWLRPTQPPSGWPTTVADLPALEVRSLGVPAGWLPARAPAGSAAWTGRVSGEGLAVLRIRTADPAADLLDWDRATATVTGGAEPLLHPLSGGCLTLERREFAPDAGTAQALEVDGTAMAESVVRLGTGPGELLRVYVVLARRGATAWRVVLQMSTACLPGADDDLVRANDHIRAHAVLGSMELTDARG